MVIILAFMMSTSLAQNPDLWIKSTPLDDGTEPNPDNTCCIYLSPDIWVLQSPDLNYSSLPFTGTPPWTPPAGGNAEYRDPAKFSVPNWVYIKVTNLSTTDASVGSEELKVYWGKAATALDWPTNWNDYFDTPAGCTEDLFLGEEITKPRRDAAEVGIAERDNLRDAILAIDGKDYPDGVSWWDKQQQIHTGTHVHGGPSFLPWHRELIDRFEQLLRHAEQGVNKSSPFQTLKLHYWDWTTDPRNSTGGTDLMTNDFMGNACGDVTAPFSATFSTGTTISRLVNGAGCPSGTDIIDSDITITTTGNGSAQQDQWPAFRIKTEQEHNGSHGYIGGNIGNPDFSFQDPFVFLLHSNVDRLFAMWQRSPNHLYRLDQAQVYGTETADLLITENIEPWAGNPLFSAPINPWNTTEDEILEKSSLDPSVVSPPFYDDVPLTIPILQPGESAIIQLPWYPPNPADYACFGGQQAHFCLVARIVATNDPMTFAEGSDIAHNVRDNNNIAWKNLSVVDQDLGAGKTGMIVGNPHSHPEIIKLAFKVPTDELSKPFLDDGAVTVNLGKDLYEKWVQGGKKGIAVEDGKFSHMSKTGRLHQRSPNHFPNASEQYAIRITGAEATLENLSFAPLEKTAIQIQFNYNAQPLGETKKIFNYDVIQFSVDNNGLEDLTGGVRYEIRRPDCPLPDAGQNVTIPNKGATFLSASPIIQDAIYTWRDDKTETIVGTGSSLLVSPSATRTYELELQNPNGCIDFDVVTVTVDKKLREKLIINPNPAKDRITAKCDLKNAQTARLEFRDVMTGQVEKQMQLDVNKEKFPVWVGDLQFGTYTCLLFIDNAVVATKQLIIMP